ncbi:MAG: MiaB/RimO family radical SAM methylthiotransferase, partial [Clostridia bacterium]|nr:MiaB/RimO family radical SAM methylthiotransferase [Clostridia bacterium]
IDPAFAESEVRRLSSEGFREIVLTGIEIASYGQDLPEKPTLADLILRLSSAAGNTRLRLGSLEPRTVTEDFCRKLAPLSNLCPHFHLSLQSGCDTVLKRMGRKYDTALFTEVVERLRRYFPNAAVTTDIITGFPGESEEEFEATCDFCRGIRFDKVHVFPYSIRTGTRAARMENQIPRAEKERRARVLGHLTADISRDVIKSEIGREAVVLFESDEFGVTSGYTENYHLFTLPQGGLSGKLARVRIECADDSGLTGSILAFLD